MFRFLCILILCLVTQTTYAQPWSREAVDLARVTVSEASFSDTDDMKGIYAALTGRSIAWGVPFHKAARRYSPSVFSRTRHNRPWIAYLNVDLEKPKGWPNTLDWGVYRDKWRLMLDRAESIISGTDPVQCVADHWGAPYGTDRERGDRGIARGFWVLANCGNTLNRFYTIRR